MFTKSLTKSCGKQACFCPLVGAVFTAVACVAGKKERYSGTEHGSDKLVDKARLDIVVFRCANLAP